MRITPTVLGTMKDRKDDAIWKQVVPEIAELDDIDAEDDPLEEDLMSPVPSPRPPVPRPRAPHGHQSVSDLLPLLHQKNGWWAKPGFLKKGELDRAIAVSCGNIPKCGTSFFQAEIPLLLPDYLLERIFKASAEHPAPGTDSHRLAGPWNFAGAHYAEALCELVKKYHPIYMNLHFNHPDELTPAVKAACGMLADAGVPLRRADCSI